MGLNPLNLQLSVPRAPELSSLQQQAMNRPMTEQTMLETSVVKDAEQKRTQTAAVDETDKAAIRDQEKEQSGGNSSAQSDEKERQQKQQTEGWRHPYKGHNLDIRL